MKRKSAVLSLITFTLALAPVSCKKENLPDIPFSFEPVEYALKSGYSASDIQGAPWINSNYQGMIEKIEKPSQKDDFYASTNYDALFNNEFGPLEIVNNRVIERLTELLTEPTSASESAILRRTYELMLNGDTESVHNILTGMDTYGFAYSTRQFYSRAGLFTINYFNDPDYIGSECYDHPVLEFNDGYMSQNYGVQTLFWDYQDDEVGTSYIMYILKTLLSAFNISMTDEELEEVRTLENTFSSYVRIYYLSGMDWKETFTILELESSSYFAPFVPTLHQMGFADGDIISWEKDSAYVGAGFMLDCLASETQKAILKNLMICRYVFDNRFLAGPEVYREISPYLNAFGLFNNEFDLTGANDVYTAMLMTLAFIPEIIQKDYVQLYCNIETKQKIDKLVDDAAEAYLEIIDEIPWMDEVTKYNAKDKLDISTKYVGYSDYICNYPTLSITNLSTVDLLDISNKYHQFRIGLAKDGLIEQDKIWQRATVYSPVISYSNYLSTFSLFPAMFIPELLGSSTEELYGLLGALIGQQLSAAYDSFGRKLNRYATPVNWWVHTDDVLYNDKMDKMNEFFSNIVTHGNVHVVGEDVFDSAFCDMHGLKVMLQLAKKVKKFNYKKFFESYAKLWLKSAYSTAELPYADNSGAAYPYLRVNVTVAQFDEFNKAFGVKPGNRMYIPKDQRVIFW